MTDAFQNWDPGIFGLNMPIAGICASNSRLIIIMNRIKHVNKREVQTRKE